VDEEDRGLAESPDRHRLAGMVSKRWRTQVKRAREEGSEDLRSGCGRGRGRWQKKWKTCLFVFFHKGTGSSLAPSATIIN
jgi:hypothetical protein